MTSFIPGWIRFAAVCGVVAAGLAIAVLLLMPADEPSPYVLPGPMQRLPPAMAMAPLASPHIVESPVTAFPANPAPERVAATDAVASPTGPVAAPTPNLASVAPPVAATQWPPMAAAPPPPALTAPAPISAPQTSAPQMSALQALSKPTPTMTTTPTTATTPGPTPIAALPPIKPSFDIVTMATDGNAVIAGRSVPGAAVAVFSGAADVGHVTADDRGNWVLLPGKPLPVGPQSLTLSELLPDGAEITGTDHVDFVVPAPAVRAVSARHPMPPSRIVEAAAGGGEVVVKPGQNLWRMAKDAYGSGPRYVVIYRANQDKIHEPDRIYPGQELAIPASADGIPPDPSARSR